MAKKLIDELGRTTLSWEEYRKKAKKIWDSIPRGESKKKVVEEALGIGYWPDKEGNMVEWEMNTNQSKEGFQRKRKSTRNANQKQTRINRLENEKFTDITSQEAAADWKKKNITQWNVGTKENPIPSNPTGKKLIKGTEDYNKHFRRYEHRIKVADPFWKGDTGLDYLSGDPENLTWTTKSQWDAKDVGEMKHGKDFIFDVDQYDGDVVYTPRKKGNLHDAKFHKYDIGQKLAKEVPTSKVAKALKAVKPIAKFVPIVGAGVVGLDVKAKTQEAIANPTWQNKTQAALGGAEAALEGFELATGGVGAIVTTPLQIGLMFADQMIHQTEDSFQRSETDWDARIASRRSQR